MMRKQLVKSVEKPRKFIKYKQGNLTILWMKNETGRSRNGLMKKRSSFCELLLPLSQYFVKTDESWYIYSS